MPRDLIKALPPELWVWCISGACRGEHYMTNLSVLLIVSKSWNRCLLHTPTLWATIHVNDADENSMALIPTFLLRSQSCKLSLAIWVPLSGKWNEILPLFSPHRDRIREVILQNHYLSHNVGCSFKIAASDDDFCHILNRVLQDLGRPNSIEFLDLIVEHPVAMDLTWVPPNLVSARNWLLPQSFFRQPFVRFTFHHLSIKASDLHNLLQHPSASRHLRHLDINSNPQQPVSPALPSNTKFFLLSLNGLRYQGSFLMAIPPFNRMLLLHFLSWLNLVSGKLMLPPKPYLVR